jgi:hypothetical protein
MRRIRRVGAAATGVVVAVVLVSGCSGSADGGQGAAGAPAATPAVTTVPAGTSTAAVPPTDLPFSTEDPYATTEPVFPPGPEGEIDKLAHEKGWEVDEFYGSASAFVADMCASLPTSAVDGKSRPQWLAEGSYLDGDGKAVLQAGVPKLCPKWAPVVKQAASGDYDRWFGNGTWVVSSKATADGEQTMPPGTYRAEGEMDGCYWERTSESGEIIDNNFATSARKITVTIRSSDGQFTSERCAVWKPVK